LEQARVLEVAKGGRIGESLTLQGAGKILKARAKAAGLDPAQYSTHSLRAGLVTGAAKAGARLHKIMQQTGHRSAETVLRYVRDAARYQDNAAAALFGSGLGKG
jgi:integrase